MAENAVAVISSRKWHDAMTHCICLPALNRSVVSESLSHETDRTAATRRCCHCVCTLSATEWRVPLTWRTWCNYSVNSVAMVSSRRKTSKPQCRLDCEMTNRFYRDDKNLGIGVFWWLSHLNLLCHVFHGATATVMYLWRQCMCYVISSEQNCEYRLAFGQWVSDRETGRNRERCCTSTVQGIDGVAYGDVTGRRDVDGRTFSVVSMK